MTSPALCGWCRKPLPTSSRGKGRAYRRDATFCSVRCRQSAHRFRVAAAAPTTDRPMRFGYADPPYPKLARRYYGMPEVNHAELIARLELECPDGWALSTSSSPGLRLVLPLCPLDVRVACWYRRARRGRSKRPRNAWEALIVRGGREREIGPNEDSSNVLDYGGRGHLSHPDRIVGSKPAAFAEFLFAQLGAAIGDELVDYFPGSGAIARAWARFQGRDASLVDVADG